MKLINGPRVKRDKKRGKHNSIVDRTQEFTRHQQHHRHHQRQQHRQTVLTACTIKLVHDRATNTHTYNHTHTPVPMMQGGATVELQNICAPSTTSEQQSDAPTVPSIVSHPEPPHCPHSIGQHTTPCWWPGCPLEHSDPDESAFRTGSPEARWGGGRSRMFMREKTKCTRRFILWEAFCVEMS